MHIDWFIVLIFAIAIPPFLWASWLVTRDAKEKRKRTEDEPASSGRTG